MKDKSTEKHERNLFDTITRVALLASGILYALLKIAGLLDPVAEGGVDNGFLKFVRDHGQYLPGAMIAFAAAQVYIIAERTRKLSLEVKAIEQLSNEGLREKTVTDLTSHLVERLDPGFSEILRDHIQKQVDRMVDLGKRKRLEVEGIDDFSPIYREAFKQYPRAHVRATSLAYEGYYWRSGPVGNGHDLLPVERAIGDFCRQGGILERVFYVPKDWITNAFICGVLLRQQELGATVYCHVEEKPAEEHLFVHFTNHHFGWDTKLNEKGQLQRFVFTQHEPELHHMASTWKRLEASLDLVRYADVKLAPAVASN